MTPPIGRLIQAVSGREFQYITGIGQAGISRPLWDAIKGASQKKKRCGLNESKKDWRLTH
jgi:hypothetical protein